MSFLLLRTKHKTDDCNYIDPSIYFACPPILLTELPLVLILLRVHIKIQKLSKLPRSYIARTTELLYNLNPRNNQKLSLADLIFPFIEFEVIKLAPSTSERSTTVRVPA
jgi:hypothetical protein